MIEVQAQTDILSLKYQRKEGRSMTHMVEYLPRKCEAEFKSQ
jgi:hypothetical protein